MKNKLLMKLILGLAIVSCSLLIGCQCKHETTSKATCTDPSVCLSCGAILGEPLGHSYSREITAFASCNQEGEVTYTCERCGDSYTAKVPKLPHSGNEKITLEAALTQMGEKQISCNLCGKIITESIPYAGSSVDNPYIIKSSTLYKDVTKGEGEQYQGKYLRVAGKVTYISDYGDLKGYYLYGEMGEGVVCWVNGSELVANTDSNVEFIGFVQSLGINQIELTECKLVSDVSVSVEPGLSKETAIELKIANISSKHINRWVSFSGEIEAVVPYGSYTWYYLKGDAACLSEETHEIGETVNFIGEVVSVGELWVSIIDCQSR
jgi:hypothetical protein